MEKNNSYFIRPAGRHILTIGSDLIQDQYAAILELVKNAYDADSPDVEISFIKNNESGHKIIIQDHGHGMSRDIVINKWLVPSTTDKLNRRTSPNGRTMQGRKGIGRFAASILGKDLLLETTTHNGEKTTAYVEWDKFEKAEYLDQIEIIVETEISNSKSGTVLTIYADNFRPWDDNALNNLKRELRKLISPVNDDILDIAEAEKFSIILNFKGFERFPDREILQPFPIFNLFDYRISGSIEENGTGTLTFVNQKARNTRDEVIKIADIGPTGCGKLFFDIRVYDREKEAIELLIKRGLTDEKGDYLGKLEARKLLDGINGIGVYRNGFRIRPLGDPDFDWLRLNEQRVQNPSLRIGSNQVVGYVQIQSEEHSGLEEKSARDGLRDNEAYAKLKKITLEVINELEGRRFYYRRKAGLGRTALKVERELEKLFAFDELKKGIHRELSRSGVDKKTAEHIIDILSKEEVEKNRIIDDIRQTVAIYQGQATLGKIINVVLHEGRRPLNYFKNQIPNLKFWAAELKSGYKPEILDEIIPIADGLGQNADTFVQLFSKLDPLATGKRGKSKPLILKQSIQGAFHVFENELLQNGISFEVNGSKEIQISGWHQDMYSIFTNLIDNSMYWLSDKKNKNRKIIIDIVGDGKNLSYIDYRDTGPGIEAHFIESEIIFEPEFSTKPNGTGLGLSIAGEAAMRSGLELKAFYSETGAYFRLQPALENK
ncbi:MAG: ATP-binding protein [Deltaproteobacteria bacterium]|nr:ATP-binding protein [Deltaproteobacteria bacterium]